MRPGTVVAALSFALVVVGAATLPPLAVAEEAEGERIADGLDAPVDLAFGLGGVLYFAELRTGNVRALGPDGTPSKPLVTVPSSEGGNGGFIGLATDPEEADVVYAFYSMNKTGAENGKINRVVRLDLSTGEETPLLDNLLWTEFHEGGRLAVGPDGFLYVTVGDNGRQDSRPGDYGEDYPSQDLDDLRGKILRIDRRTGEGAPGNPGGGDPRVFARGFRNPFGIDVLDDGRVFVSDNGPVEGDEVNLVVMGGNYGWPYCNGPCDREGLEDPLAAWSPTFGPTGIAVKDEVVYVADFNNGLIRTADVETGERGVFWTGKAGPLLDVERGPDGCLYASTFKAIWRFADDGGSCAELKLPVEASVAPTGPSTPTGGTSPVGGTPPTDVDLGSADTPGLGPALVALALAGVASARRRR